MYVFDKVYTYALQHVPAVVEARLRMRRAWDWSFFVRIDAEERVALGLPRVDAISAVVLGGIDEVGGEELVQAPVQRVPVQRQLSELRECVRALVHVCQTCLGTLNQETKCLGEYKILVKDAGQVREAVPEQLVDAIQHASRVWSSRIVSLLITHDRVHLGNHAQNGLWWVFCLVESPSSRPFFASSDSSSTTVQILIRSLAWNRHIFSTNAH